MGPADPCVLEHEGVYYLYPTTDGATCRVMRSTDLIRWTGDEVAFRVPPRSPWKTGELWAPEVEYIHGRFYLYYTAGKGGLKRQHIGVADADSPAGPFEDRSLRRPLIRDISIDAECFQDGADLYLYYVMYDGRLSTWVVKLKDPLTLDDSVPPQLCLAADAGWEGTVVEGPSVIRRDGRYYMFYSGHYAHTADYAVGVAVADHPMGPWQKQPAPFNPIFRRNDAIGLYGPGHGHHVTGPDGISDWYLYHQKLEPTGTLRSGMLNYHRRLALDRLVPVSSPGSTEWRFLSSGGSTVQTQRPRLPFAWSHFNGPVMPETFLPLVGTWSIESGRLSAPSDGTLVIRRPLELRNLQDFRFEWWLHAPARPLDPLHSAIEFTFGLAEHESPAPSDLHAGLPLQIGFRLTERTVQFIAPPAARRSAGRVDSELRPLRVPLGAHVRRVTIRKTGSLWQLLLDREVVCEVRLQAQLGDGAVVRTTSMPCRLSAYRQVLSVEQQLVHSPGDAGPAAEAPEWQTLAAALCEDHYPWSTDPGSDLRLSIRGGMALTAFDLSADFCPLGWTGTTAGFSKHGLIHSFHDPFNYAMILVDEAHDLLASSAVVNGEPQAWQVVPIVSAVFSLHRVHQLAVSTDEGAGDFVYSLNGREMLRRAHPGLGRGGRIGYGLGPAPVRVSNLRYSGWQEGSGVLGELRESPAMQHPVEMTRRRTPRRHPWRLAKPTQF